MNEDWRRRIASLLVVRASGHGSDGQRRYPRWELPNAELRRLLEQGVGGVILLGGSASELRQRTARLQSWSRQPLLLCADVEEGVGQRFEGASWLVPPLALGRLHGRDPQRAEALADLGEALAIPPAELAAGASLPAPLVLDVSRVETWPHGRWDAVFSANTCHILPEAALATLLACSRQALRPGGLLLLYGPFHDHGVHTAASNAANHRRRHHCAAGCRCCWYNDGLGDGDVEGAVEQGFFTSSAALLD